MREHKRFKDGAWRLVVEAGKDPVTGKRRQINRTVREPSTRAGETVADVELAKLIVEVSSPTAPSSQVTVGELPCAGSSIAAGPGRPARRVSPTGP